MPPESISIALLIACAGLVVVSQLTSTKSFLFLVGLFTPMLYPWVQVGVNVFLYQTVVLLALLMNVDRFGNPRYRAKGLLPFCLYAVALTGVWYVVDIVFLHRYLVLGLMGLGQAQTIWKMPVQLVSLLVSIGAFYIPQLKARTIGEVERVQQGILVGIGISASAGVAMAIVSGRGFIGDEGSGSISIAGVSTVRIGGLSGEPKMLGAIVSVALVALMSDLLFGRPGETGKRRWFLIPLFLVILVATWSTSAWIGCFVGAVFLLVPVPLAGAGRGWPRRALIIVLFALMVAFAFRFNFVEEALYQRVTQRLSGRTSDLSEQKDSLVLDVYREKPLWLPFGFGVGGFDLEGVKVVLVDPRFSKHLQYVRTPTPSSTGPRLLGDVGLIGMLLLAVPIYRVALRCFRMGLIQEGRMILACGVVTMCVSFIALASFCLLLGCIVARVTFAERQLANVKIR